MLVFCKIENMNKNSFNVELLVKTFKHIIFNSKEFKYISILFHIIKSPYKNIQTITKKQTKKNLEDLFIFKMNNNYYI